MSRPATRLTGSLLAAVLAAGALLLTAPAASAAGGNGGGPSLNYHGGGQSTNKQNPPAPPVSTPLPPSPTGGTGTTDPNGGLAPGQYWVYSSGSFAGPGPHTIPNTVQVCANLADGRWPIGWTTQTLNNGNGANNPTQLTIGGRLIQRSRCNYQSPSVVGLRQITCPVHLDGQVSGPTGPGTTGSSILASVSENSPWANGGKRATTCDGQSLYGAVAGTAMAPGWWSLNFVYQEQSAMVRTYGGTQPDVILSLGPVVSYPYTKGLTVHCSLPNGWTYGQIGGLDFSPTNADACRGNGPLEWSCPSAATGVTFDGHQMADQTFGAIFHDGLTRQALWPTITPNNVRGISQTSTLIAVDPGSGGLNTGYGLDQTDYQPTLLRAAPGGGLLPLSGTWLPGQVGISLAEQAPTMASTPIVIHRAVFFTGQFPTTQVVLGGVDWLRQSISTSTRVVYTTGHGTCATSPLILDSFRAREDNTGGTGYVGPDGRQYDTQAGYAAAQADHATAVAKVRQMVTAWNATH